MNDYNVIIVYLGSTGSIILDNVIMEGFHVFRIISLTDNKERLVVKRRVYIGKFY